MKKSFNVLALALTMATSAISLSALAQERVEAPTCGTVEQESDGIYIKLSHPQGIDSYKLLPGKTTEATLKSKVGSNVCVFGEDGADNEKREIKVRNIITEN